MIKIKVSDMLGKYKMTRKQLSELTGIRPNTIGALYNETVQRLDIESLDKICRVFECGIEEIIEYIPDVTAYKNENTFEFKVAEQQSNYKSEKRDNTYEKGRYIK